MTPAEIVDAVNLLLDSQAAMREREAVLVAWIESGRRARPARPDGEQCWCLSADVVAHYPAHSSRCSQARSLLGEQQPASEA